MSVFESPLCLQTVGYGHGSFLDEDSHDGCDCDGEDRARSVVHEAQGSTNMIPYESEES